MRHAQYRETLEPGWGAFWGTLPVLLILGAVFTVQLVSGITEKRHGIAKYPRMSIYAPATALVALAIFFLMLLLSALAT